MKGKGTQKLLIFALCLAISMIPFTQAAARRENRKQPYSHVSAQKEEVSLITRQPEAGGIMILGDEPEAPPSFSVEVDVPDGAEISCVWDVDGQPCENGTEFVLTQYQEMPCGVHQIQCHIFCRTPEGIERTEDSIPVSWILCRGIMMDTVLTFSDVHGDYPYIGQAISEIMAENEGRIPALILCSGDWANERRAVSREVTESVCIPAILAQAGGIDTLLVAGNHENGAAAEAFNLAMDLGADESGVVFLSGTDGCGTSAGIQDLAVFRISFDDIVIHEDEKEACSYAGILENLKAFLETQKDTG